MSRPRRFVIVSVVGWLSVGALVATIAPSDAGRPLERAPSTAIASPSSSSSTTGAPVFLPPRPTTTAASRGGYRSPPVSRVPGRVAPAPGGASSTARASWYDRGCCTASGEKFNPEALTFAHLSMRFGTTVRFCHDGRCVVARCNDRGPAAWTGKTFDLSRGAFRSIAPLSTGVIGVTWEVV